MKQDIFLDSSMVEHSAVNRVVVGSSPTRGVFLSDTLDTPSGDNTRLHGQAVKTSPFHGGNTGSIPVGVTDCKADTQLSIKRAYSPMWLNWQSS